MRSRVDPVAVFGLLWVAAVSPALRAAGLPHATTLARRGASRHVVELDPRAARLRRPRPRARRLGRSNRCGPTRRTSGSRARRAALAASSTSTPRPRRRLDRSGDFGGWRVSSTPRTPRRSAISIWRASTSCRRASATTRCASWPPGLGFVGTDNRPGRPGAGPQREVAGKSGHRTLPARRPPRPMIAPGLAAADAEAAATSTSPGRHHPAPVEHVWNRGAQNRAKTGSVVFSTRRPVRSSPWPPIRRSIPPLRRLWPGQCATGRSWTPRTGSTFKMVTAAAPWGPRRQTGDVFDCEMGDHLYASASATTSPRRLTFASDRQVEQRRVIKTALLATSGSPRHPGLRLRPATASTCRARTGDSRSLKSWRPRGPEAYIRLGQEM